MKCVLLLALTSVVAAHRFGPPTGPQIDAVAHGSEYHYSWLHDGRQEYEWGAANAYCARLGREWKGISIETPAENSFVIDVVPAHGLPWIWTSGKRSGRGFVWGSGAPVEPFGWSHTGGHGRPQPDNRENGQENGLAVLNDFYQDGVKWHDVAFHHRKAIICERSAAVAPPPARHHFG